MCAGDEGERVKKYGSYYFIAKKESELFKIEKAIYSEKQCVPEIECSFINIPNAVVTIKIAHCGVKSNLINNLHSTCNLQPFVLSYG